MYESLRNNGVERILHGHSMKTNIHRRIAFRGGIIIKKYCIILVFLASIMLLCSCEEGVGKILIFDDSNKKADARMEQLLKIIANKDEEALEKMFSKQALNDAVNFDDGMEYLFGLIQGDIVSWKQERLSSGGLKEYGKKYTKLFTWYTVVTDKNEYLLFTSDYTVNTINPDNVGYYTVRAIKKVADEISFDVYWDDLEMPGIIKPEE